MSLPALSVKNPVFANLLMWAILIAGAFSAFAMVRELFPTFQTSQILVRVPYPGATPDEIDRSVTRRLERSLEGLQEVKELTSAVFEGVSITTVQLISGADEQAVIGDVRTQIDLVRPDLPDGADEPEVQLVRAWIPVIAVTVYGDATEDVRHAAALKVRDELLELPSVSQILISGQRDREIWAEVSPTRLEEHGLTFEAVGQRIQRSNLQMPGGQLRTAEGNVTVRTDSEKERARALEDLVIRDGPDGNAVLLRDVGKVRDTFEDRVEQGRFEGKPATLITVFRAPEQDAIEIAESVKAYVQRRQDELGDGLTLSTITDLSKLVEQRIDLMIRNGRSGLILVVIALALFLNLRVAFWVAVGLPISFMGTFLALHLMGQTINLLSLFGLIVVLGIVVDDAIVIGERVFTRMRQGLEPGEAAIKGAREVTIPVVAAVSTTIVAFLPLAFIDGVMGDFLRVLPLVVIAALSVSLIEAFLILPAHLGHGGKGPPTFPRIAAFSSAISETRHEIFEKWIPGAFSVVIRLLCRWRYVTLAGALVLLIGSVGLIAGGLVDFVLIQELDAEAVTVTVEMTAGTPEARTEEVVKELEAVCLALPERHKVFAVLGTSFSDRGQVTAADPATIGQITIELKPAEERRHAGMRSSFDVVDALRKRAAGVPGASKIKVAARQGGPGGEDIELRITAPDRETLGRARTWVRELMDGYDAIDEAEDDFRLGKLETRLDLRPAARPLGMTTADVAFQVRHALFGFEAQEIQGEEEEVKVRVLLPLEARNDLADLARLRLSTPRGGRVPLDEVARIRTERGYASVARADGRRACTIRAQVDENKGNVNRITTDLQGKLADIGERFPGAAASFEGRRKETNESLGSLKWGYPAALFLIYAIVAILFRSYGQPFIVMACIPFSLTGAILGHWITAQPFTLLSMIGMVALSGIVVNDSLILVDFINRRRRDGMSASEAAVLGSRDRLRPILLTSITTICGLAPLMLETSFQAQFLIPMAVSIVFGLAVATVLIPVLNPILYLVGDDLRNLVRWTWSGRRRSRPTDLSE